MYLCELCVRVYIAWLGVCVCVGSGSMYICIYVNCVCMYILHG